MTNEQINNVRLAWYNLRKAAVKANTTEQTLFHSLCPTAPKPGESKEFDAMCAAWDGFFDALMDMDYALANLTLAVDDHLNTTEV